MTAPQISIDRAKVAAKAADEKLGKNIAVIDVSGVMAITDVFVIVSADNERQVAAIVQEVEDDLTEQGVEPKRREGGRENRWVLLDYGVDTITGFVAARSLSDPASLAEMIPAGDIGPGFRVHRHRA